MFTKELIEHIREEHGMRTVAEVAGIDGPAREPADDAYLRGFHDGMHGRIDADDLKFPDHEGHG